MTSMAGMVALVSGGARGIGAATARQLAQSGAHVVIGDLAGTGGEALAGELAADFIQLDVTSEADWKHAVQSILERHGKLDVMVNAAGIVGDVVAGSLEQTTLSEWRRVLSVNLDGTFLGCREVMGPMKRAGSGAIINVASIGAYYPTVQSVAYGASKGAVTQLTKSVALCGSEGGARVRCNSVHPGMIATRMLDDITSQLQQRSDASSDFARQSAARLPLGAPGQPEDVARLICFLASADAGYITGSEFSVDGGWRLLR